MSTLRKGLPPLPLHMTALPIDERGYPIPFFVKWIDGKPDFRLLDEVKFVRAIRENRCSVCGVQLGKFKSFVGGPMNILQMLSGEPPMHHACALFSVQACPFLLLPLAKRRKVGLNFDEIEPIGEKQDIFFEDNPGVSAIFTCTRFHPSESFRTFHFDDMCRIEWFTEGRAATADEIRDALQGARDRLSAILTNAESKP